ARSHTRRAGGVVLRVRAVRTGSAGTGTATPAPWRLERAPPADTNRQCGRADSGLQRGVRDPRVGAESDWLGYRAQVPQGHGRHLVVRAPQAAPNLSISRAWRI